MATLGDILLHPLRPAIETCRDYSVTKLRRDMLAGLSVSVVELPQAMAYAVIAGVPPQYGIYTSIIQGILGALLSSSNHLATGPTNTQSLLIASIVARLTNQPEIYLQLVFGLTLIKGLIQLAFALGRMGNMVRYVSRSVIVGVAAGAGVLIITGQMPSFLGLQVVREPHQLPGVLGDFQRLWPNLGAVNPPAVWIGLGALAVMVFSRYVWKWLPSALLAVVLGGVAVWALGLRGQLPLVGELPRGLPGFRLPSLGWRDIEELMGGALALALLGMIESVAIVKSIGSQTGERVSPNREFFAQGAGNFISAFFQCIPGSGSFTRSALDVAAGAATRFGSVFNGLFVALIFLALAPLAAFIPYAALAAVLFVIAVRLIDWRYLVAMAHTSRGDAAVCGVTFVVTLTAPLQYAVFVGVFLNIALYLRTASRLHITEMVSDSGDRFVEREIDDAGPPQGRDLVFVQIEGDLFFAVADELEERLGALASGGARVVIVRLKRTHSIDATVLAVLERFARQMQSRGGHLILCGVRPELMAALGSSGMTALIGRENIFETGPGVFTSAKQALARAKEILGRDVHDGGLDMHDDEAWAWEV